VRAEGVLERLESSGAGRALISLFTLVTLVAVVATNLPGSSYLNKTLSKHTQPYLNAIGLDQNWGVFAPDPRRESIELEARITYPDGATETWRPPERDAVIGTYSDYRWRKLWENVIGDGGNGALSVQLALWVARERRKRREAPRSVTLFKRSSPNDPPGPGAGKRKPYTEAQFYELAVDPSLVRGSGP